MFVYINATHLERNYSGPDLFQLIEISQELYDKLLFICNETKMKLYVAFTARCDESGQENVVSYNFSVKKIKLTPITDRDDITFLEKYFGSNFCNYDFMQNIFRKSTLTLKPTDSELRNFAYLDDINESDTKFIWIAYNGNHDNMPIYDYSFDSEDIDNFKKALENKQSYPRSLDNTLWMPKIKLSKFDLYTLPKKESNKLKIIFEKYDICLSCYNVIEWEYDDEE